MPRPIDEFGAAWEALSGSGAEAGWCGIPVARAGVCELMAARRFPGNEEALLARCKTACKTFQVSGVISVQKLPPWVV